jgi:uncharacterized delta-60 repeat protein
MDIANGKQARLWMRIAGFALALSSSAAFAQSVDDEFAPAANGIVSVVRVDAQGRLLVGGLFTQIDGQSRLRIARLNGDGRVDDSFATSADGEVEAILPVGDRVLIGGAFANAGGLSRSRLALLEGNGNVVAGAAPQADDRVYALSNGLVANSYFIGGNFSTVNGQSRRRVARLIGGNLNLDGAFVPPNLSGSVRALAVQTDGKLLVAGSSLRVGSGDEVPLLRLNPNGSIDNSFAYQGGGGTAVSVIVLGNGKIIVGGFLDNGNVLRLNPDGSRDPGFSPPVLNQSVTEIALQPDGRLLVVGNFSGVSLRDRVIRLNENGSLDAAFGALLSPFGTVTTVAVQPNGGVVIGGAFTDVSGLPRARLARISYRGALDTRLDAAFTGGPVEVVAAQPDGKLLVGGGFTHVNGQLRPYLARINPSGSVDAGFTVAPNNVVRAIAVLGDRSVVIAGAFNQVNGSARLRIAKLTADGALDANFVVDVGSGTLHTIALQGDGRILIGGSFTSIDGVPRQGIARLNANSTLDTSFVPLPLSSFSRVRAIAVRADDVFQVPPGMVYLGGETDGTNRLERLTANGSLDGGFFRINSGPVFSMVTSAFGPVNYGAASGANTCGRFLTTLNGDGPGCLASPDQPVLAFVRSIGLDYFIGGAFTTLSDLAHPGLVHILTAGNPAELNSDFDFPIVGAAATVNTLQLLDDGKLVVAGDFTSVGGESRTNIARISESIGADTNPEPLLRTSGVAVEWDWLSAVARFIPGAMTPELERAPILLVSESCCADEAFVPAGGPRAVRANLATGLWEKPSVPAPRTKFYLRWRYQVSDGHGGVSLYETPIYRFAPRSPQLQSNPLPNAAATTVVFPSGAAGTGSAQIIITPVGGEGGSSALACAVQNVSGPGSFSNLRAIPSSFEWRNSAGSLALDCTRAAQVTLATLVCTQSFSDESQTMERRWGLTCPAASSIVDPIYASGFE